MFDKEYSFRGSHAEKVDQLTAKFDDENQLFQKNKDVLVMAPIVGFLYQRKSDVTSGEAKKINGQQVSSIFDDLWFNYRLIMLLDKNYEPDFEKRVDKAFRYYNTDKAKPDEELFNQYVRGGVDVLYEKLIEKSTSPSDYLKHLYDFMEELDERYNKTVDIENIQELCALARK